MAMEKRGDISEQTPNGGCCGGRCKQSGQPMDKQAADSIAESVDNSAIDAVIDQTEKNAEDKA